MGRTTVVKSEGEKENEEEVRQAVLPIGEAEEPRGYFADVDVRSLTVSLEDLFKTGAHFGHRKERRHPKMDEFVYTYREGVGIIDLKKTMDRIEEALDFIRKISSEGRKMLFVGTKKHTKDLVRSVATVCESPFVDERWLGGTFTNFGSIRQRIKYFEELERKILSGEFAQYTKFEQSKKREEYEKMSKRMGGLRTMKDLPAAVFVVDAKQDSLAVREAVHVGVPVVSFVDTNDDPSSIDYPIPANNDAISAVKLILGYVCKACLEGVERREAMRKTDEK